MRKNPAPKREKLYAVLRRKRGAAEAKRWQSVTKRYPSQTRHSKGRTLSEYMTKL